jgi:hypothetical protein
MIVFSLLGYFVLSRSMSWLHDLANAEEYVQVLRSLEQSDDNPTIRRQKEAIRIALSAISQASAQSGSIGESLRTKSPEVWAAIEAAAREYPHPNQQQVDAALPIARSLLQKDSASEVLSSLPKMVLKVATISAALGGMFGILLSWLFRGGPLLYLLGISLQTLDGRRAGPGRCLLRALLAWAVFLPFLPFWPKQKLPGMLGWSAGSWEAVQVLALLLGIGCLIYGIASPERGVADRLAGTQQVLR